MEHECLTICMAHRQNSITVIETLPDMILMRGVPEYIHSDHGVEMTAKVI